MSDVCIVVSFHVCRSCRAILAEAPITLLMRKQLLAVLVYPVNCDALYCCFVRSTVTINIAVQYIQPLTW